VSRQKLCVNLGPKNNTRVLYFPHSTFRISISAKQKIEMILTL
jgi:hypothetical protein